MLLLLVYSTELRFLGKYLLLHEVSPSILVIFTFGVLGFYFFFNYGATSQY